MSKIVHGPTEIQPVWPDRKCEYTAEILRLRAENEKLREQYDAGVAAWNPVYEIVLNERDALKAENEKLRAERDLWISRFEDFRKNAARLEEARSRPMRLVGSAAAAALKEIDDAAS